MHITETLYAIYPKIFEMFCLYIDKKTFLWYLLDSVFGQKETIL